jgi:hypothetical protein
MARSSTSFGAKNRASLKHGARSARVLKSAWNRLHRQIEADIVAQLPEGVDPNSLAVQRVIRLEVAARQIWRYLEANGGVISTRGQLRASVSAWMTLDLRAENAMARLARGKGRAEGPLTILEQFSAMAAGSGGEAA